MKVLYILHTSASNDGSSKALRNFLPLLRAKGVEMLVVCPAGGGITKSLDKTKIRSITLHFAYRPSVYPWSESFHDKLLFLPRLFGRWMVNMCATIELLSIAKQFQPDIIHTNSSVCAIGYYVSRLLHIKHIWHIREYGALDFHYYYYYPNRSCQLRRYRKNDSYTLCITRDIQCYNHLEHSITSKVIYDGVLSSKDIVYIPEKKPYFLFAGFVCPAKGVLPLVEAYIEYHKQCQTPLPLWIAGKYVEDTYTDKIKEIISQNKLEKEVIFLGLRQDILQLYQEAQALIVPSLSEGFGFITTEAMFSGCLVIGHDVAGTKEQFDNGKQATGQEIGLRYITQNQLVQYLLDVTICIYKEAFNKTYEPMILRGQRVVKQLYTTECNAEQIYQFYKNITQ